MRQKEISAHLTIFSSLRKFWAARRVQSSQRVPTVNNAYVFIYCHRTERTVPISGNLFLMMSSLQMLALPPKAVCTEDAPTKSKGKPFPKTQQTKSIDGEEENTLCTCPILKCSNAPELRGWIMWIMQIQHHINQQIEANIPYNGTRWHYMPLMWCTERDTKHLYSIPAKSTYNCEESFSKEISYNSKLLLLMSLYSPKMSMYWGIKQSRGSVPDVLKET